MPKRVDFLVVGSGIAGLTFAKNAAQYGDVLILTKKNKADSNTNYAQGGIAAVTSENDSYQNHIEDTIKAGERLCHREAVEIMVQNGPQLIQQLYEMGCRFSVNEKGTFELGREGGHSRRRIVHAKDFTGYEIERVLLGGTKNNKITISENDIALDLIVRENECLGLYYYDATLQRTDIVYANATILATGGIGQAYLHTTNPPIATGDGIAMAFRAGAKISNMEFVQFHPTSVYGITIDGRAFLVSEAVRGEGGILKNVAGEAFMQNYSPDGNLAPRDIVARACVTEMLKSGSRYVLLDISHRDARFIKNRFPTIFDTCSRWGIDITRESIPVVPAAHYICGGIQVTTWAEASIQRLFALGECACTGVHGANRLASNSLLEALVFATRAAEKISSITDIKEPVSISLDNKNATPGPNFKHRIKELMHEQVGVIRTEDSLLKARIRVCEYLSAFDEGIHLINAESRNVVHIALLIIESAIRRKESRGLHFIKDYPQTSDAFLHDTILDKSVFNSNII